MGNAWFWEMRRCSDVLWSIQDWPVLDAGYQTNWTTGVFAHSGVQFLLPLAQLLAFITPVPLPDL